MSGKSPLSNGIVGSTAGGEFALELKCAGYDGVIVKGRSETPVYILVTDGRVEIRNASELWGLEEKETVKAINAEVRSLLNERRPEYGLWKEPSLIYVGPAGENMVRNAAIMQKWSHACGYGGYGAVMDSKNLKAVVAKGTGPQPAGAHPEEMPKLWEMTKEAGFSNPQRNLWGTGAAG